MVQWYVIRASGAVALVLLSVTFALGLLDRSRVTTDGWPRFVIDQLHRNASLLAVVFLAVHIITSVTDKFVSIDLSAALIPFQGSYRPFWVGLGAVSLDLMIAVLITSLLRTRLGISAWRRVHWLAYGSWPIAVIHGLGMGTDAARTWMVAIDGVCIASVLVALAIRLAAPTDVLGQAT